jgi:hypothetical protein
VGEVMVAEGMNARALQARPALSDRLRLNPPVWPASG